jgi:hypothetical protein
MGLNQQWKAVDAGSGFVALLPRHVNRCLDVPGAAKNAGVQLQIYDCNQSAAQQFKLTPLGYVTTPPGRYQIPFAAGQTWYVCQGYNGSPSHTGDKAIDVTFENAKGPNGCFGNKDASTGQTVYAPIAGSLARVSDDFGGVCITPDGGGSVYLGHLLNRAANGKIKLGDPIGTIAPAGQMNNGGYAHVHISARAGTGCNGEHVALDAAHSARIVGAPDMTSSGAVNQWAGQSFRR